METKTMRPESPQAGSTSLPGSVPAQTDTGHNTAQGSCETSGETTKSGAHGEVKLQ